MPKKAKPIEPPTNAPEAPAIPQATGERFYPPFESAADEDEALIPRAEKWAQSWNAKNTSGMDKALKGLTLLQANRVQIMGQRIAGGLPPIPKKKEKANASQE
jgi:hypothetical protein